MVIDLTFREPAFLVPVTVLSYNWYFTSVSLSYIAVYLFANISVNVWYGRKPVFLYVLVAVVENGVVKKLIVKFSILWLLGIEW